MTEPLNNLSETRPIAVLDRAGLAAAVALAELPVSRKSTIPILANLRLTGSGGALTVTGTDMDVWVTVTVPGAADARLDTTVPAKLLKDILAKAKDSELASLETCSGEVPRCGVDLGGVRFNLNAIEAADFPVDVDTAGFSHTFQISAGLLRDMLDKTRFAVSTEETRYYLNGIYLHTVDRLNTLRAVATDGHRLALMAIDAPEGASGMPGVIVPRQTVLLLLDAMKALGRGKVPVPDVTVSVGPARIRFAIGAVQITSKLVDGAFPDYERVIPRGGELMRVTVKPFVSAIEQVTLISTERGRAVKLDVENDRLSLSVNNPDSGSSETSIPCHYCNTAGVCVGFNSSYLLDVLDEMAGDSISVMLIDSGSPAVIFDPADSRFTAVLMPMRV